MNRKQKCVIAVGVVLILAAGLFPPYDGEKIVTASLKVTTRLGYYFLFLPPSRELVARSLEGEISKKSQWEMSTYRSRIVFSEVFLEMFVIVISTFGSILFLGKRSP